MSTLKVKVLDSGLLSLYEKRVNVEGDAGQAEQLGNAISQAIQAELMEQKRPGGLLYS